MRTPMVPWIATLLVVCGVVLLVGCRSRSVDPTSLPSTAAPTETGPAEQPSPGPEELLAWQRFRATFGLRSDEPWIRAVADDPSSANEIGVPLLSWEIARMVALNLAVVDLVPALETYGHLFPGHYAGTHIEGRIAVIQFSGQVEERRAALEMLLGRDAPVEVRQVRYSLDDLGAFARAVEADREWFSSVGAELSTVGPRAPDNVVELTYRANSVDVEAGIVSHFRNVDWLILSREGPLPWAGGYGRLVVRIVDRAGRPVEAGVLPNSADERVSSAFLPKEVNGLYEEERVEAVVWEVIVTYFDGQDEVSTSVIVRVPEGGVGNGTVVVER